MQKTIRCLLLALCLSSITSCAIRDTLASTKEKLDFLNQKIDGVKEYSQDKLAELETKAEKTETDLANVGIKLDANDDGKVTKEEAFSAAKDVATGAITDSDKRALLTDPDFWVGLGGAVVVSIGAVVKMSKDRRKKVVVQPGEGAQV